MHISTVEQVTGVDFSGWQDADGEHMDDRYMHEAYTQFLDETYGYLDIAGSSFDASDVLAELDPIAYRTYFLDWADSEGYTEVEEEEED